MRRERGPRDRPQWRCSRGDSQDRRAGGRPGSALYLANRTGGELEGWPLAFSHRGDAAQGDENTLAAFQRAVDAGYAYLELDIRTSRDGHAVVFHDEALDGLTNGSGPVSERSLEELRALSIAGEPMAALEDLFHAAVLHWPHARFNIDVKDAAGAPLLAQAVHRYGLASRVLVASFEDTHRVACVVELERLSGRRDIAQSPGMRLMAEFRVLSALGLGRLMARRLEGITAFQVPVRYRGIPVVTRAFVRQAHALGIQVHVWTIDEPEEMKRLLGLGVDGLMTDRPDVLAEVMRENETWPQGRGPG